MASYTSGGQTVLFAEEKMRQILDIQVKHNETLQEKLDKCQAELKAAKARLKHFDESVENLGPQQATNLSTNELVAQIALRDSVISCLQKELALAKAEKFKPKEERPKTGVDSLEEHLLRAKARSQAIAEQYANLHEEETKRVQQALGRGGGDRSSFDDDGSGPQPASVVPKGMYVWIPHGQQVDGGGAAGSSMLSAQPLITPATKQSKSLASHNNSAVDTSLASSSPVRGHDFGLA